MSDDARIRQEIRDAMPPMSDREWALFCERFDWERADFMGGQEDGTMSDDGRSRAIEAATRTLNNRFDWTDAEAAKASVDSALESGGVHVTGECVDVKFHKQTLAAQEDAEARIQELEAERDRLREALGSHRHTDECLHYASQTGKPFCIVECRDAHRDALREGVTNGYN